MRLSCALVACNDNPKYLDFWPVVKQAWWDVVGIPCIMIYVADTIPETLKTDPAVRHFKPIEGLSTLIQAQEISYLYPCLLKGDGNIIVTDIYTQPVEKCEAGIKSTHQGIPVVLTYDGGFSPLSLSNLFRIKTLEDIYGRLHEISHKYPPSTNSNPWITILGSKSEPEPKLKRYNTTTLTSVHELINYYRTNTWQKGQQAEFEKTDLFVVEITDKITEVDIVQIKDIVFPKKILVWIPDDLELSAKKSAIHYKMLEYKIDRMFTKTAVLVWKSSFTNAPQTNRDNFWGIGDMLRGVIGVYKLSKKYNFDLIVDKSLHPLSMLLKNDRHRYTPYLENIQESVGLCMPHDVEPMLYYNLINNPNNNCVCFYSNMPLECYDGEITDELRRFVDYVLRPMPSFEAYMTSKMKELGLNSYTILHYRMGDDEMVRKECSHAVYENAYAHLIRTYKDTDIVMSDSAEFKALIRKKGSQIRVLDTKICHVGLEQSYEALRDTVFEFNLLRGAAAIRSYSRYSWVSGFVYAVHKIYDIPLEGQCDMNF